MYRLTLSLVLITSCKASETPVTAVKADSAGITIVTNTAGLWQDGSGWQIDPEPMLQIGHNDTDDPRYDLVGIRSGLLLADGDIIAVLSGSRQIHRFNRDGEWVRSFGREGEGPGEMRFPSSIILANDTIYMTDLQLSRITAYHLSSDEVATWPFPNSDSTGRVSPVGRLTDGRWLGTQTSPISPGSSLESGISRTPTIWHLIDSDLSNITNAVATLPGAEQNITIGTGTGGRVSFIQLAALSIGRGSPAAVGSQYLWAGDNSIAELRRYTPSGQIDMIVRWQPVEIPVTDDLLARMKAAELERWDGNPQMIAGVESKFKTPPPAEIVPYFQGLHLDTDENLWVREYRLFNTDSVRFTILSPDGQELGNLSLPPKSTLLDIVKDQVLTSWQDEDDLEYLRVYRLKRR